MPDAPSSTRIIQGSAGPSSYQIAQQHGFTGTEQQWIDSLYGQTGARGSTGPPLVNRGDWLTGTVYNPSDYVFSAGSVSGTSVWLVRRTSSFTSTVVPASDPTSWIEWTPVGVSGYSGYSGRSGYSGFSGYSGPGGATSGYSGFSGAGTSGFSGGVGASGMSGYSGSGVSGYSGLGLSGYSGFSGLGLSGYSGFSSSVAGSSGYSGFSGLGGGASGYSGFSGHDGVIGVDGVSGYSGYSAATGTSGFSGFSGLGGGASGYSGFSGPSGTSGYSGYSAYSGYSGYSAPAGTSGFSGYSGSGGGASGYSGYSGKSGYSGGIGGSGYSGFSAPNLLVFTTQTDTDYVLVIDDANTGIKMSSSSAHNLTVPANSSVAFPIGTQLVIEQAGTGTVTIVAGGGVTLQGASTTAGQYSIVSLIKQATDTWVVLRSGTGISGYSGYSGAGISGYSGYSSSVAGQSGFSGYSGLGGGASGYSGYSSSVAGTSGFSGYSGSGGGASGYSGYSGFSGFSGPNLLLFTTQTNTDYVLVLGDANTGVSMSSSSPHNLTIPLNATVAFPIGTQIPIEQGGTGAVTIVPTGGVTLNGANLTSAQYSVIVLIKQGTNTWLGATGVTGASGYSGYSSSVAGASGYSGYSGSGGGASGYSGYSGVSGYSGYSGTGLSGYSGYSGPSGYSGYSGISGWSGYSGLGLSGYSGYSSAVAGASGYSGYSGLGGGSSGYSGYSGESGYSGYSGLSGYSGYSGSGLSGYSGFSGLGISGYSGYSSSVAGVSGYSGYSGTGGGASGYSGYSGFSSPSIILFQNITDSDYTLALTDANKGVNMVSNGLSYSLVIPANASVAFPTGTQIVIEQGGTAPALIDSGAVTLYGAGTTEGQYTVLVLIKTGTDEWLASVGPAGPMGLSGYSGYSSSAGASGYSGFSGPGGGASGFSGYSGESGYSGYSGSGVSGYSGYSGLGLSGYSGYSATGLSGYSGFSGENGVIGSDGDSGYSGYSAVGLSGYSGYSSLSGYSGFSSSVAGASGYSGYSSTGLSGYSGYSGSAGVATIPVGNTLYVDAVNGNDSTGTSGRFDLPYLTISAALADAVAGDVVQVGPGTFTENGGIVVDDDVNLVGAGQGLTIIESTHDGRTVGVGDGDGTGYGIIAPGNNSVISDLSILAMPWPATTEFVVPIYRTSEAGSKNWTNVTFRNCHLRGTSDALINTATMGDMTFINVNFESHNDLFSWQGVSSHAVLINCELRMTADTDGLSGIGIYNGDLGGGSTVKAYGCRIVYTSVNSTNQIFPIMSDEHLEVYDCVIDYTGQTPNSAYRDVTVATAGTLWINNIRKADGTALLYDGVPTEIHTPTIHAVAELPANPLIGQVSSVSDGAASLAYGATVTAGGSAKYGVWYDGSNWIVVANGAGSGGASGYSGYSGAGLSGYSGYSGISGANGTPGASGYSGYSGISGYSGFSSAVAGPSGYSGYSGLSGWSGYSGLGLSGYSGYSGLSGYSGYSSLSGYSGYSSVSGFSGYSAYSGYSGPNLLTFSTKTDADYALVLADANTGINMSSASAHALNIPLNATQAFPIGTQIVVEQGGTSAVSITITATGTLNGATSTNGQYSAVVLIKQDTNTWLSTANTIGASGYSGVSGYSGTAGMILVSGNSGNANAAAAPSETLQVLTGDATTSTTTALAAVMTTANVPIGTYKFEYFVRYQSAATATGVRFALDYTGTVTWVLVRHSFSVEATAASSLVADSGFAGTGAGIQTNIEFRADNALAGPTVSVDTLDADMLWTVKGIITVSDSSSLVLMHAADTTGSTVKAGTNLRLTRLV